MADGIDRVAIAARESDAGLAIDEEDYAATERAHVRYSIAAAITGLVCTLVSMTWLPGWRGALLSAAQGLAWCAILVYVRPTRWLVNLVVVAWVAGFVELAADLWLVKHTGTLVYPEDGPFLAASPAYMPIAWFGMLSGGMALGLALRRRHSAWIASAGVALALGIYIPAYEWLAALAGWWRYESSASIGPVPLYIVLGEVLLALPLVALTEHVKRVGVGRAAAYGLGLGLWIWASYAFAHAAVTTFG
jgi:hypothetical protein